MISVRIERREIGIDAGDADLGEDGGERREDRRQDRPELPAREGAAHRRLATSSAIEHMISNIMLTPA